MRWSTRRKPSFSAILFWRSSSSSSTNSITFPVSTRQLGFKDVFGLPLVDVFRGEQVRDSMGTNTPIEAMMPRLSLWKAALAEIKNQTPRVAARFEAFVGDLELANGFKELTDAGEQRRRFETELEARRRAGRATPPLDEAFLAALAQGLPPCAGVALGLDRLIALAAGLDNLAAALPLAHRL